MKTWALVMTVAMCMMAAAPWANALEEMQTYDPMREIPEPTTVEKALEKLGRGLSNILFGWAEIPVTWDKKLKQGKPLSYLLTTAPVLGAGRALMRTGTGVFETVTFPFSDIEVNYEPLLEPEYIF